MSPLSTAIILILSIVIAASICKVINQNTFGTTGAYVKRFFIVWLIVFFILMAIAGKLTGAL